MATLIGLPRIVKEATGSGWWFSQGVFQGRELGLVPVCGLCFNPAVGTMNASLHSSMKERVEIQPGTGESATDHRSRALSVSSWRMPPKLWLIPDTRKPPAILETWWPFHGRIGMGYM
jgi:hypothetical protein